MAKDDAKAQKGGFKDKLKGFGNFVWNSETKEFLGRGAKSWAQILLYYLVFYACLAGFFAINLSLFFTTIDDHAPRLQGYDTLLKGHPGMGFRPLLDGTTLVKVNQNPESYAEAVANINATLKAYEDQSNSDYYQDCSSSVNASNGKSCRFDLSNLGPCNADSKYGYADNKPCILLKLNKIYGWTPEQLSPDSSGSCNADYQKSSGGECLPEPQHIGITCEGENAADIDYVGNFSLYPSNGIPAYYYPYTNQKGYLAPLVMVQFEKPLPGALIMVWCKAWANNIYHNRNDLAGSVHFELLYDNYSSS